MFTILETCRSLGKPSTKGYFNGRKPSSLPGHFNDVISAIKRELSDTHGSENFSGSDQFAEVYLANSIDRKRVACLSDDKHGGAAGKTRAAAIDAFFTREAINRRINDTQTFGYYSGVHEARIDDVALSLLIRARSIIQGIIGDRPNYQDVINACEFGSGASAILKRTEACRELKYRNGISCTRGLLPLAVSVLNRSPSWKELRKENDLPFYVSTNGSVLTITEHNFQVCNIARYETVPKDSSTDRGIAMEPEMNGYFQKGTGVVLRRLLRNHRCWRNASGMDISRSGELNSELARLGSIHKHIATVDAKQASDSITLALCEFLLPKGWFGWLHKIRTPFVKVIKDPERPEDAIIHELQMISGMGNGSTFELESIIFYAIGLAASEKSALPFAHEFVSIHGDDLIVPSDVFDFVQLAFERAGIVINTEKSFTGDHPFRESCGGHWYEGYSVKPFYVKDQFGLVRGDWFWLANSLLLWLSERQQDYRESPKGKRLIKLLAHCRWFASSGNPSVWATSIERSRRSGIFSEPPHCKGPWYRMRNVVAVPSVRKRLDDESLYVAWLAAPQVQPTVYELLFDLETGQSVSYDTVTETEEKERWTTISWWPSLPKALIETKVSSPTTMLAI